MVLLGLCKALNLAMVWVQHFKEGIMPTIIQRPDNRPSFKEKINAGLQRGLEMGSQLMQEHKAQKLLEEENKAYPELSGLSNPKLREIALSERLRSQSRIESDAAKRGMEEEMVGRDYEIIKKRYGQNAADLWRAAPTGGKTAILDALIEGQLRGMSPEDVLGAGTSESPEVDYEPYDLGEDFPDEPEIQDLSKPKVSPRGKLVDFDKGITPREKVIRQEKRYEKNLPLYQALEAKQRASEMEKEELDILSDLSPKIGSMQRLNINPKSGDLIVPALASPEAQRFVKTVNDFTRLAKDSYGTRVTNFDLTQFMRRLPTLANSEEGRRQILQQMNLINSINQAYDKALLETFDQYGGIRNVDYDKAQNIARKKSAGTIRDLKDQFHLIEAQSSKNYSRHIKERKKTARKGFVLMEKDGQIGEVPEEEVNEALKDGAKVL